MKFLIKIEDAINQIIVTLLKKLIGLIPHFFFDWTNTLKHIPHHLKDKIHLWWPKINQIGQSFLYFFKQYLILSLGKITSVIIFLKSHDFKKTNKKDFILIPFTYTKSNPLKVFSILFTIMVSSYATFIIFENTKVIIIGTRSLRRPSSVENKEENLFIKFKNHKSEVKLESSGGHGASSVVREIILDIIVEAQNIEEKNFLEEMEEMLEDNIEAFELHVESLPLSLENKTKINKEMILSLNEDFKLIGHPNAIKNIQVNQVLLIRPTYYRQNERFYSIKDINLQLFLENTHRNRQVTMDFSIIASNRNIVLYLTDHKNEYEDHLTNNIEPIIPQLPIEDEGKRIIKDKIKMELNIFLEKNNIEGKVLEIYVDNLITS